MRTDGNPVVAYLSVLATIVTIVAAVVGGAWAFYLYRETDSGFPTIELDLSAETHPFTADKRLLIVTLEPKNVGKVPAHFSDRGVGFRVSKIPHKHGLGEITPEELPKTFDDRFIRSADQGVPVGATEAWTTLYIVEADASYVATAAVTLVGGRMQAVRTIAKRVEEQTSH
jgi:hypothetical protein